VKKQILIGEESFERIIEGNYFYIDKTLFIKELLENRGARRASVRFIVFNGVLEASYSKKNCNQDRFR